jgi:dipeptidyl aminopeptidase/acylaminoacyl peptidase
MATTTTNFGWDIPQSTDLVKDGATAIAALGQDIDTALVDLKGGTSGQVLAKASGTDLDFSWVAQDDSNAIQNAIVDAKGDLIAASAADTPARLAVGTNGQILTADSTEATGMKWATFSGGGKVLQVVSTTKTDTFTSTSTSAVDVTGLSVTITPSAATSKILVFVTVNGNGFSGSNGSYFILVRGATDIAFPASPGSRSAGFGNIYLADNAQVGSTSINHLDEPATTSATTYKVQGFGTNATNGFFVNRSNTDSNALQFARTVSAITVMEIGA